MWILYALLSAVFAALVTIFAKIGIASIDSTLATMLRTCVMAVLLIIITLMLGKHQALFSKNIGQQEIIFLALSGCAGALSLLFYFAALKSGDAGKVAVIDRSSLLFITLFSVMFLQEKLSGRGVVGIALVAVGAILVALK